MTRQSPPDLPRGQSPIKLDRVAALSLCFRLPERFLGEPNPGPVEPDAGDRERGWDGDPAPVPRAAAEPGADERERHGEHGDLPGLDAEIERDQSGGEPAAWEPDLLEGPGESKAVEEAELTVTLNE